MIVPWSAHFTEILDWIGLPAAVVVFDVVDGVVVEVVVGLVVVVVDFVWVVLVVVVVEVDCVGGCASEAWGPRQGGPSPPWPVGRTQLPQSIKFTLRPLIL